MVNKRLKQNCSLSKGNVDIYSVSVYICRYHLKSFFFVSEKGNLVEQFHRITELFDFKGPLKAIQFNSSALNRDVYR